MISAQMWRLKRFLEQKGVEKTSERIIQNLLCFFNVLRVDVLNLQVEGLDDPSNEHELVARKARVQGQGA